MSEVAQTQSAQAPVAERRRMWLILLGPPILWSVRFMAVYVLIEIACRSRFLSFRLLGLAGVSLVNLGLGIVTVAATAGITWLAYRVWRETPAGGEADLDVAAGLRRTLGMAGLGLGLIMIFVTVLEVLPVFFINPCRWSP